MFSRTRSLGTSFVAALVSAGFALISAATAGATGTNGWTLSVASPSIVPPPRPTMPAPTPDGLPDGEVATHDIGDIRQAWYTDPTDRYGHGILGDAIEAGTLKVKTAAGNILSLKLPAAEVFEDRTPRLADLDGDGAVEVITIRSSTRLGASVTIYGLSASGELTEKAATEFIGRSNRWLNIAAIAGFAGNGRLQIAYVETPHIGGTLHLYDYVQGKLVRLASQHGFSNHAIGSRHMDLSLPVDLDGGPARNALIVPNARRSTLKVMSYDNGTWTLRSEVALPHRIETALGAIGSGPATQAFFRLEDGKAYVLSPR
ncbi:hypothetical protein [Roseibium sp.]|uniref:hypothetical protein n=1 Tax=Roseibium sp. TaxID=1936156 RepID=UPI003A982E01